MSTKSGAPEISGLETMSQEFERFRSRLSDALKPIRESIRGISLITEAISPDLGTFADQMKPISDRMRGMRFIGEEVGPAARLFLDQVGSPIRKAGRDMAASVPKGLDIDRSVPPETFDRLNLAADLAPRSIWPDLNEWAVFEGELEPPVGSIERPLHVVIVDEHRTHTDKRAQTKRPRPKSDIVAKVIEEARIDLASTSLGPTAIARKIEHRILSNHATQQELEALVKAVSRLLKRYRDEP